MCIYNRRENDRSNRRNAIHSYVDGGQTVDGAAAAVLKDMPEGLNKEGCAVLYVAEPLKEGQELLFSYRYACVCMCVCMYVCMFCVWQSR